jgi:RNA polymerase sigma-70 factor (ECF subfamily)
MSLFQHPIIEHIPSLRRYARALTGGSVDDADDLVQDTLERAYAKWHLWRVGWELRPWLFSIMHNIFVNQVTQLRQRDQ